MLTVTGRESGSCFKGIFSGGPIGESSRFRFFFFSNFRRSSERLLLCSLPLFAPVLQRLSLLAPALLLFFDAELIGVIVIDDFKFCVGCDDIGMISMPGRRSSPVKTELLLPNENVNG